MKPTRTVEEIKKGLQSFIEHSMIVRCVCNGVACVQRQFVGYEELKHVCPFCGAAILDVGKELPVEKYIGPYGFTSPAFILPEGVHARNTDLGGVHVYYTGPDGERLPCRKYMEDHAMKKEKEKVKEEKYDPLTFCHTCAGTGKLPLGHPFVGDDPGNTKCLACNGTGKLEFRAHGM